MSQQKKISNYLVSEPNYHTTKFLGKYLLAIEMKKQDIYEKTCFLRTFDTRTK